MNNRQRHTTDVAMHQLDAVDIAVAEAKDPERAIRLALTVQDPATLAPLILKLFRKSQAFDRIAAEFASTDRAETVWVAVEDEIKRLNGR